MDVADEAQRVDNIGLTLKHMLAEAGRRSGLTEEQATRLAIEETRAERAERAAERRA